jgi:hypothetical protein
MRSVYVDPATSTVRIQGGATLGDLDRETHAFGLAVPSGVVPKTGIAGLTLGGGVGWLIRKYGMSIDNLLSCQIVTADGRVRAANRPDKRRRLNLTGRCASHVRAQLSSRFPGQWSLTFRTNADRSSADERLRDGTRASLESNRRRNGRRRGGAIDPVNLSAPSCRRSSRRPMSHAHVNATCALTPQPSAS